MALSDWIPSMPNHNVELVGGKGRGAGKRLLSKLFVEPSDDSYLCLIAGKPSIGVGQCADQEVRDLQYLTLVGSYLLHAFNAFAVKVVEVLARTPWSFLVLGPPRVSFKSR